MMKLLTVSFALAAINTLIAVCVGFLRARVDYWFMLIIFVISLLLSIVILHITSNNNKSIS